MSRSYITVDIDIADFDNDALVQEVIDRDLVWDAVAQLTGNKRTDTEVGDLAVDAMQHLMCGRLSKAEAALEKAIAALLPPQLLPALTAIREGRRNDAIVELDYFIQPSLAATAKKDDLKKLSDARLTGVRR